jgi:hypothetical protein
MREAPDARCLLDSPFEAQVDTVTADCLKRRCKQGFLMLIEVEEIAGIYFECAGELENIVDADILFAPLD